MKKLVIKITTLMLLGSMSCLNAQSKVQIKDQPQSQPKKELTTKKVYTFRTYEEKEMKAKAAYKKLTFNLKDSSYPKDLLEIEKREMICIILGKVSNESES